jgi:hypothetical protein
MFQQANMNIKGNVEGSPLQTKIRELEEGKVQSRQLISENEKTIDVLDMEIEKLKVLESRLGKIYSVKNYKDLGAALEVSLLCNKVNIRQFVEYLNDLLGSTFQFSLKQNQIADLTIWQGLYLLFGNLSELDQKKSGPAGDPGAVDPEKIENSFDPNKKFM